MVKGLIITAIGMGLVFIVIIMLWGVMALLVALTSGKRIKADSSVATIEESTPADSGLSGSALKRKAAAVAVAYLLASDKHHPTDSTPAIQEASNWLALGRARQLNQPNLRGQRK